MTVFCADEQGEIGRDEGSRQAHEGRAIGRGGAWFFFFLFVFRVLLVLSASRSCRSSFLPFFHLFYKIAFFPLFLL
jgi:hypothetical protein